MTSRIAPWCVLVGALTCLHCDNSTSESRKASPGPAGAPRTAPTLSGPSRAWVDLVRASFPGSFCEDKAYFVQCFDVTAARCKELVAKHFDACLAKHPEAVPQVVNETTGRAGGQLLGNCVGSQYEIELAA